MKNIPQEERALVLQGGGSLGAYEVGAFKAVSPFIKYRDIEMKHEDRQLFDIVAGTSIGAINAAILVSYVVENKTWDGSAEKLEEFWNYISTESMSDKFSGPMTQWWNYWRQFFQGAATGEAARRYYSAMEFAMFGVPKVFSSPHTTPDTKFFDISNRWYRYSNQFLKDSLEQFVKFPIATSLDDNQPRLILTSVDVMDGKPVVFDSYAKKDGTRKSEYGRYIMNNDTGYNDDEYDEDTGIGFEHIIRYPKGITADHVLASAAVPVSYDYVPLEAESYNFETKRYEQKTRYFWDGGLLANTPLAQLIVLHRQFWYKIKGLKESIPKLGVLLINLHPSRIDKIPWDFDGVLNRNIDITFADKSERDQNVLLLISDAIDLSKKLIDIAKSHGVKQNVIDDLLDSFPESHGKLHGIESMKYRNMIEGQFNIGEVIRIERKITENETSKKIFDFSSNTIKQLIQNGYDDVVEYIDKRFGHDYMKDTDLQQEKYNHE
ncbi:MAG TPA: patatin-like phospholipase family protein [Nitrosarchaeum sp.]|nr:patatin-like phospholipase family protein [Nitrosarchaeum sp.]